VEDTVWLAVRTFGSLIVMLAVVTARADNWPHFRGPRSDGMVDASGFPLE
jgi:hypothetical protein